MTLPYINAYVLDHGLVSLMRGTTRLTLHVEQPPSWDEANVTVVASREFPILTGPYDALPAGRKVTCEEISDGWVFSDATVGFWALLDDKHKRLLAAAPLVNPLPVEERNRFTLSPFDVIIPGV